MAAGKGSGVPTSPLGQTLGKGSGRTVLPGNDPRSLFQSAQAQGLQNLYRPFGGGYQAGNPVPPLFGGGNPVQAAQQRQQAQQQATRAQQNRAVQRFQPNFFRRDS